MLPETKMGTTVIDLRLPPSDSESVIDLLLPQDLITEILLYLPVKSLVKFKCVSKPWMFLISSSQFIKSHLATSSREGQYSNYQLLFTPLAPNCVMKHCSLFAALHNPSTNVSDIEYPSLKPELSRQIVSDIEYPSLKPELSLQIVGIINGLVCLAIGEDELYLWNPNLRKSKRLPSSNFSLKGCSNVYGFGYNESNDDYKVVLVRCVYCHPDIYETKVKVYSLRADSWRRSEDFKGGVPSYSSIYANGKIWWTAMRMPAGKWNMLSLDMASDKYEEVQGPLHEADANNSTRFFIVLGGRLYLHYYFVGQNLDLWAMTKFGVEESWSKTFSVPINDVDYPIKRYAMMNVLWISGNSEIVLEDEWGALLVYTSKGNKFRKIQLGGLRGDLSTFFRGFVYAESLVSPNGP